MEGETASTALRFDRKAQMREYSRLRRQQAKEMPPEVQEEMRNERMAIHKHKAARKRFCDLKILASWVSDPSIAAMLDSYTKDGSYKTMNAIQMATLRGLAVRSKPGEECPVPV